MEKILCAAMWFKDYPMAIHSVVNIDKGIVLCGYRHGHIIGQFISLTGKRCVLPEAGEYEQGFLTDKNRFISREEAHDLFIENGGTPEFEQLYSEDLY